MNRVLIAATFAVAIQSTPLHAKMNITPSPLAHGFTPINFISPLNIDKSLIPTKNKARMIKHFCSSLGQYFEKYKWETDPCGNVAWKADLLTKNGHPLIYMEFGSGKETTLLLGGVHPDELTPIPMAFRFAKHLQKNPHLYKNRGIKVIIAPLVNPDGFMRNIVTRNNANGVDPNRNFYTMDWYAKAKNLWVGRRNRNIRHFPGYFPNTEVESIFQVRLIDSYHPDKIQSIHAPLGFLDYDGPGDRKQRLRNVKEKQAKQLVYSISEKAHNYRVVDFTFYPGSLGNYAGNERHIPTVTLELETTEIKRVDEYWEQFLPGMMQSINYPFKKGTSNAKPLENATSFSTLYKFSKNEAL